MGGSDERLVRRAASGDRRAFDAIYRRYRHELYRFCLAMTCNPQDAQEALQNTMVNMLRSLPGEQREIRLKPWLYRIARNESIETHRRRHGGELDSSMTVAGVAETVETRERLRFLLADLAQLPERQRATLVMREMAGLGFAEIAAAFGTSQGSARQALYEARLRLRKLDNRREIGWDEEIERRSRELSAIAPIPVAAALGSAGAGKTIAGSVGLKAATTVLATVALVAVVGHVALIRHPPGGSNGGKSKSAATAVPFSPAEGPGSTPIRSPDLGIERAGSRPDAPLRPRSPALDIDRIAGAKPETDPQPSQGNGTATAPQRAEQPETGNAPGLEPTGEEAGPSLAISNSPDESAPEHPAHRHGGLDKHPEASNHGQETAAVHRPSPAGPPPSRGHPHPTEATTGESSPEPEGSETMDEDSQPPPGRSESQPGKPDGPPGRSSDPPGRSGEAPGHGS